MDYLDIQLQGVDTRGNSKYYALRDFLGSTVILYFYPKDNTSGCSTQAQDFRDVVSIIGDRAVIVGVSPDSVNSHTKFRDKYQLNFVLLSDVDKRLANNFGVWVPKSMYGRQYMGILRSTFVLDTHGTIVHEWRNVKVKDHVSQVLEYIDNNT
ncbi:MAG: peroxiredoxin [Clostridiales bacterium]|jgi:peroxiredoxin Q/BCP|nr:peroxiredoxin [Clostridiales bacterium]